MQQVTSYFLVLNDFTSQRKNLKNKLTCFNFVIFSHPVGLSPILFALIVDSEELNIVRQVSTCICYFVVLIKVLKLTQENNNRLHFDVAYALPLYLAKLITSFFPNTNYEQGWQSGESIHLLPMWPRFDFVSQVG